MKAKPKAAGKSKVTFDARKSPQMAFAAFTIERETDTAVHPQLVTMKSKIAEFVGDGALGDGVECREQGRVKKPEEALRLAEMANENRAKAKKWRTLSSLPKPEGERLDWKCYADLAEGVDFLVAHSEHSDSASVYLSMVIRHALMGLQTHW